MYSKLTLHQHNLCYPIAQELAQRLVDNGINTHKKYSYTHKDIHNYIRLSVTHGERLALSLTRKGVTRKRLKGVMSDKIRNEIIALDTGYDEQDSLSYRGLSIAILVLLQLNLEVARVIARSEPAQAIKQKVNTKEEENNA